jgi:hypothetical protein
MKKNRLTKEKWQPRPVVSLWDELHSFKSSVSKNQSVTDWMVDQLVCAQIAAAVRYEICKHFIPKSPIPSIAAYMFDTLQNIVHKSNKHIKFREINSSQYNS